MNSFDVIIIGAGIIGLSSAYKLIEKNPSIRICIVEKENFVSRHQSGHNSGVIHSGIYYKPGSLKAQNCLKGYKLLVDFCIENNIKFEICGKVIIATKENELTALRSLYDKGIHNGLNGIKIISQNEIKNIEPFAVGLKGIFVPQTGIVDFKIVSEKIYNILLQKGVNFFFNESVISIPASGKDAVIKTEKNFYKASVIASCAGLYSDKLARMINPDIKFKIIPFRGEYFKLKKSASHLVKNLIYPVPDPDFPFLGVHFTRRVNGIIEAGPNAVLAFKREGYEKFDFNFKDVIDTLTYKGFQKIAFKYWKTGLFEFRRSFSKKEFVRSLKKLIPAITSNDIEVCQSGVRAQVCDSNGNLVDDFLFTESPNSVSVCNAPSPAATSCFAIGDTVSEKILKKL